MVRRNHLITARQPTVTGTRMKTFTLFTISYYKNSLVKIHVAFTSLTFFSTQSNLEEVANIYCEIRPTRQKFSSRMNSFTLWKMIFEIFSSGENQVLAHVFQNFIKYPVLIAMSNIISSCTALHIVPRWLMAVRKYGIDVL